MAIDEMTALDAQDSEYNDLLDDYWRGAIGHDFDLLRRVVASDFIYWMNTDHERAKRRALGIDDSIDVVFGVSYKKGLKISLSDVRRFTCGDIVVQQDIATVVGPQGSSRFARCFVIQFDSGKVRRVWEYYDADSATYHPEGPPNLAVPE